MRRLLLLLLTFLLPLQLLAATVGELPSRASLGDVTASSCLHHQASEPAVQPASASDASFDAGQSNADDEADAPTAQAELEDHTLPARIATPDIPWQPFPHAFTAPLSWPSFVRDQLRPPPLA